MFDILLEPHQATALRNGQQVAAFRYRQSRRHFQPGEFFCSFSFNEGLAEEDRRGLAQRLYETALPQMLADGVLLLRMGVMEDDPLLPVLRRLGFRTYRHVFTPVLDVRAFSLERLKPFEKEAQTLGFEITSLADLGTTDSVVAKFRALHDEVYSEGSGAVPATPHLFSLSEWREDVLDEDFLPDACFIALRGDEYAAFANLFPADLVPANRGRELDTATFGTSRAFRHHHRPVMLALWSHLVCYARDHGYETIRAEIDSDYPWILEICAELPMTLGEDFVSLVRAVRWEVL